MTSRSEASWVEEQVGEYFRGLRWSVVKTGVEHKYNWIELRELTSVQHLATKLERVTTDYIVLPPGGLARAVEVKAIMAGRRNRVALELFQLLALRKQAAGAYYCLARPWRGGLQGFMVKVEYLQPLVVLAPVATMDYWAPEVWDWVYEHLEPLGLRVTPLLKDPRPNGSGNPFALMELPGLEEGRCELEGMEAWVERNGLLVRPTPEAPRIPLPQQYSLGSEF